MNFRKAIILVVFLLGSGIASAKAPKAPTNLRVKPLGANSFRMEWQDNSTNEIGWEIRVSLGDTPTPKHFLLVPSDKITSYVVVTNDVHGKVLSFQIAAYNGTAGFEKISKPSSAVTVTAFDESTFGQPLGLSAKPLDDGRIRISWKDKSTTEGGYQIQYRKGSGKWKDFGTANPDVKFKLALGTFEPDQAYSFRVRAFKQNPPVFTPFSKIATTKTLPFSAPSNLVATADGDGAISLKWKDRSSHEGGFEIESKSGAAAFTKLGEVGPNVTSPTPITGFAFDTNVQLRVRAFRVADGVRVYTGFSNVAATQTPLLASPTDLFASTVNDASVKLTWKHNSARELGFQIQYRETGTTDYLVAGNVAANVNEFTAAGLTADKSYQFRLRAYDFFSYSGFSAVVQAQTKDGIVGGLNPPILVGKNFRYAIQTSLPGSVTNLTVTGLPAGLVYNAATHTITGTLSTGGNYSATLTATFSDGSTSVRTLTLRSINPQPLVSSSFTSVNVAVSAQKSVSLSGKFSDPDTASAARVTTTMGTFDIILFSDATPHTVDNFLDYVDDGRYNNTFFHRAPLNFVVQGGGFAHTAAKGFYSVEKFAQIPNEPGLPNVRGTVAMAKLGDLPNSATSQFFVNLNDLNGYNPNNPPPGLPNLDTQNGGFTVFGRVAAPGMALMDSINQLPRGNYAVTIGGESVSLDDVPVDAATAPITIDPAKLVKITSVDAAPILTYQVLSQNTAVATAAIAGSDIIITGVATGSTTITVQATDLDGQTVSQSIPVTVP